eukprot:15475255-Alexandrium_andersonii.AAC.1
MSSRACNVGAVPPTSVEALADALQKYGELTPSSELFEVGVYTSKTRPRAPDPKAILKIRVLILALIAASSQTWPLRSDLKEAI